MSVTNGQGCTTTTVCDLRQGVVDFIVLVWGNIFAHSLPLLRNFSFKLTVVNNRFFTKSGFYKHILVLSLCEQSAAGVLCFMSNVLLQILVTSMSCIKAFTIT